MATQAAVLRRRSSHGQANLPAHVSANRADAVVLVIRQWLWKAFLAVLGLEIILLCGCASPMLTALPQLPKPSMPTLPKFMSPDHRAQNPDDEDNDFENRVETRLLKDYISGVTGNQVIVLQGIGLVMGLDGTGGDPPPSTARTDLRNEMSRHGVRNANEILRSPNTALVMVRAFLPTVVRKDDTFDVEVSLPPNSEAKSLKGGWLLETRLFEQAIVDGGRILEGKELAVAAGPVLTAVTADRDTRNVGVLRRGRIPGGATSRTESKLKLVLRNEMRSERNSDRVAKRIAARFYDYNAFGRREALAVAKTDALIELKVHSQYRNNFPRYQNVIRSIALHESEIARQMRMEKVTRELRDPRTSAKAALELEAVGEPAIPFLKKALNDENLEVRFYAAEALAYLEDSSGIDVLREAAEDQPALRVYALAAMSAINDAEVVIALRELMSAESLETRYGAFRALSVMDQNDPFIAGFEADGRFRLHVLKTSGRPMIHITHRRRSEVVIFGSEQQLHGTVLLRAGNRILIKGDAGSDTVTLTHYELNNEPERVTVSREVSDIIMNVVKLGATYPEVVQLLMEAERQKNLPGVLGIDELPQAGRTILRQERDKDSGNVRERKRKVGSSALVPGLFDRLDTDDDGESSPSAAFNATATETSAPSTGAGRSKSPGGGSQSTELADLDELMGLSEPDDEDESSDSSSALNKDRSLLAEELEPRRNSVGTRFKNWILNEDD